MTENKELNKQIEPLLKQMLLTLATFHISNDLKRGIEYRAMIKGSEYTLKFTAHATKRKKERANMG